MLAVIAKEFGVLPSQVARDLQDDPERLSWRCLPLLRYAEAYSVYKSGNKKSIEAMKKAGKYLDMVEEIDMAFVAEEIEAAKQG